MSTDYLQLLLVVIYLMSGTLGIVLLVGWVLKRFGPPKKPNTHPGATPKK
jgi:flagellar biogenesis protein FliO